GSGALPFARMAFEAAIRRGGVGVAGSLAAFSAGYEAARSGEVPPPYPPPQAGEGERSAQVAKSQNDTVSRFPPPLAGECKGGGKRGRVRQGASASSPRPRASLRSP